MLLFPNALCCSLYECNCVVTKIFTCKQLLPANNFLPTSAGNPQAQLLFCGRAQAQLHFRDDQQRAFGISNISNSMVPCKKIQLEQLQRSGGVECKSSRLKQHSHNCQSSTIAKKSSLSSCSRVVVLSVNQVD